MTTPDEQITVAHHELETRVQALKADCPGISFGYIGNVGVDRSGPFDDRSWRIFLPHPGRVGTFADCVSLGRTADLPAALARWPELEAATRKGIARQAQRDDDARTGAWR